MLIIVVVVIGLIIDGCVLTTGRSGSGAFQGNPVTSSANLRLTVHTKAGMVVEVADTSNRIRQAMAADHDPAQRQPLVNNFAALHRRIDEAGILLVNPGDPQPAIDHWLGLLHWSEFFALEQQSVAASKRQ